MKKKENVMFWTTVVFTALVQIYPFFSSLFDLRSYHIIPEAFYNLISMFNYDDEGHGFTMNLIGIFAFIFFVVAIIYAKKYNDKIFYFIGAMSIIACPIVAWFSYYLDDHLFYGAYVLFPLSVYVLLITAVVKHILKKRKTAS